MSSFDAFKNSYCEKAVAVLFVETLTEVMNKLLEEQEFQSLPQVLDFCSRVQTAEMRHPRCRQELQHSIVPQLMEVGVQSDEHGRLHSVFNTTTTLILHQYDESVALELYIHIVLTGRRTPMIVWDGARIRFLLPNLTSITYTARRVGMIVAEREEEPW
ncbi:hypothetical protein HY622_00100 [Candidatus Uhrbacteria bacterium]|nr:hypothetical protein [Candidatus Uhrbacteria bacterium]